MMLYLHIPFCVKKCLYCDFCSLPAQGAERFYAYVAALRKEMRLTPCKEEITSVFLGGGTPSLLPPELLLSLFAEIRACYTLATDCEISLEANPGTLTEAFLDAARAAGVNRLSLGVQAMQDHLLKAIGRIHSARQAEEAVQMARRAGFSNISIDLMYALPGQLEGDLLESVNFAISYGLPHVSMYALTIEEKTPFGHMLQEGRLRLPDEEQELSMQAAAMHRLKHAGLSRYEVSNFAKPGMGCRHNLGYWYRVPYLGLGLSAHGFDGSLRHANTSDMDAYLRSLSENRLPRELEQVVTEEEAFFETLMLGLRTVRGVELPDMLLASIHKKLTPFLNNGFLTLHNNRLALTEKGFPVMNAVLVELL